MDDDDNFCWGCWKKIKQEIKKEVKKENDKVETKKVETKKEVTKDQTLWKKITMWLVGMLLLNIWWRLLFNLWWMLWKAGMIIFALWITAIYYYLFYKNILQYLPPFIKDNWAITKKWEVKERLLSWLKIFFSIKFSVWFAIIWLLFLLTAFGI